MFDMIASIAGPIIGGLMQGESAEDASNAQSQSTAAAIAEQKRQYDQSRADLAPWRDTGGAAQRRLATLLGLGTTNSPSSLARFGNGVPIDSLESLIAGYSPADQAKIMQEVQRLGVSTPEGQRIGTYNADELGGLLGNYTHEADASQPGFGDLNKKFTLADFWDDPITKASFQFGLEEGTKALDRMAGARGNRNSGAQLKALTRFGTDYTGQKAGESYNRFYGDQDRTFNRLAGVSGSGQTASANTASMGQNTANNISGLISGLGNARGAAAIAGGNAVGGTLSQVGNNVQQMSVLNRILNQGSGWGGSGWQEGFVW